MYQAGSIIQRNYTASGMQSGTDIKYVLNPDGTVAKETFQAGSTEYDTVLFQYNPSGYLLYRINRISDNGVLMVDTMEYEYTAGNQTKITYRSGGVIYATDEFTYAGNYPDQAMVASLGEDIPRHGLFGKNSVSLPVTETYTDLITSSDNYIQLITYTFKDGLPVLMSGTTTSGTRPDYRQKLIFACR